MSTTMGTGNVYSDDVETLRFADESEYANEPAADEVDEAREHFAQNALDHDRNPTEADFVRWLARQRMELLGKARRVAALADQYAGNTDVIERRHVAEAIRTLLTD
jgi:hypothetical protein